jgi:peptidoglycan hydrolase FlgJ
MSGMTGVAQSVLSGTAGTAAAQTQGTAAGTAAAANPQRHARLVAAAQQFEGMMLEQMLKPLQKSQDTGFGQDPDGDRDGSLDTMSSYGTEAVANSIAKSGGLGIARRIVADVSRIDARTQVQPQTQVQVQVQKQVQTQVQNQNQNLIGSQTERSPARD